MGLELVHEGILLCSKVKIKFKVVPSGIAATPTATSAKSNVNSELVSV